MELDRFVYADNAATTRLLPAVLECPWLLKSPILRNGNKVTVGYHPEIWEEWLKA